MTGWQAQKKEINALNLFYSGVKGEKDGNGISSQGYQMVGPLLPVSDWRNDVEVRPDFTLFSGESVIFVDVETADEIGKQHQRQAEKYQSLNLEAVEEFLKEKGRADGMDLSIRDLEVFDYYMAFRDEVVKAAKKGGPGAKTYEEITDLCGVLSQRREGTLSFCGGLTRDGEFEDILSDEIGLPRTPSKEFLLTREAKPECLAVSLAQEVFPNKLSQAEEVQLTPSDVPKYYNRKMDLGEVRRTLEYLTQRGVCDVIDDHEYVVSQENLDALYEIEEHLRSTTVDEYLKQHGGQQVALTDY